MSNVSAQKISVRTRTMGISVHIDVSNLLNYPNYSPSSETDMFAGFFES